VRKTWITALAIALVVSACAAGEIGTNQSPSKTTGQVEDTTSTSIEASTTTAPVSPPTTMLADPAADEYTALMKTLEASAGSSSGRIEGSFTVTGANDATGLSEATIAFSSAFDADTGDGSFVIDMSPLADAIEEAPGDLDGFGAIFAEAIEFRQVGDRAYAKVPFLREMLGVDTEWISMPAEDGTDFASGFETVPSDPTEVLGAYEGADATVANLGTESVNGVAATHYRITFDTTRMVDELTDEERAELEASGIFADGSIPFDLWISSGGDLVRLVLEIDASSADLPREQSFDTMVIRYDAFDIGGDVVIVAPPDEDVTPIEEVASGSLDFDFGV
jgi:hypothetical protein